MSTKLFNSIVVLAAVLLVGPGMAGAALTTPTAATYSSGGVLAGLGPGNAIDGDPYTFSATLTDTGAPDVTGHLVYDMGSAAGEIVGMLFTSRSIAPPPVGPEEVSFFYFADDDPTNNALVDDIEGDADIILIASHTFGALTKGEVEAVSWTGGPNARYIGMRIESGYEPKGNYQIGEVAFDVVPEPASLALLSLGGLLMLTRRKIA
jgi:hypothetical protein